MSSDVIGDFDAGQHNLSQAQFELLLNDRRKNLGPRIQHPNIGSLLSRNYSEIGKFNQKRRAEFQAYNQKLQAFMRLLDQNAFANVQVEALSEFEELKNLQPARWLQSGVYEQLDSNFANDPELAWLPVPQRSLYTGSSQLESFERFAQSQSELLCWGETLQDFDYQRLAFSSAPNLSQRIEEIKAAQDPRYDEMIQFLEQIQLAAHIQNFEQHRQAMLDGMHSCANQSFVRKYALQNNMPDERLLKFFQRYYLERSLDTVIGIPGVPDALQPRMCIQGQPIQLYQGDWYRFALSEQFPQDRVFFRSIEVLDDLFQKYQKLSVKEHPVPHPCGKGAWSELRVMAAAISLQDKLDSQYLTNQDHLEDHPRLITDVIPTEAGGTLDRAKVDFWIKTINRYDQSIRYYPVQVKFSGLSARKFAGEFPRSRVKAIHVNNRNIADLEEGLAKIIKDESSRGLTKQEYSETLHGLRRAKSVLGTGRY